MSVVVKWTREEIERAIAMYEAGSQYDEIATILGRSVHGVTEKLRKCGVETRGKRLAIAHAKSVRNLCLGREPDLKIPEAEVTRCVPARGGGYIVALYGGGSGWSETRIRAGARVSLLPGGQVKEVRNV